MSSSLEVLMSVMTVITSLAAFTVAARRAQQLIQACKPKECMEDCRGRGRYLRGICQAGSEDPAHGDHAQGDPAQRPAARDDPCWTVFHRWCERAVIFARVGEAASLVVREAKAPPITAGRPVGGGFLHGTALILATFAAAAIAITLWAPVYVPPPAGNYTVDVPCGVRPCAMCVLNDGINDCVWPGGSEACATRNATNALTINPSCSPAPGADVISINVRNVCLLGAAIACFLGSISFGVVAIRRADEWAEKKEKRWPRRLVNLAWLCGLVAGVSLIIAVRALPVPPLSGSAIFKQACLPCLSSKMSYCAAFNVCVDVAQMNFSCPGGIISDSTGCPTYAFTSLRETFAWTAMGIAFALTVVLVTLIRQFYYISRAGHGKERIEALAQTPDAVHVVATSNASVGSDSDAQRVATQANMEYAMKDGRYLICCGRRRITLRLGGGVFLSASIASIVLSVVTSVSMASTPLTAPVFKSPFTAGVIHFVTLQPALIKGAEVVVAAAVCLLVPILSAFLYAGIIRAPSAFRRVTVFMDVGIPAIVFDIAFIPILQACYGMVACEYDNVTHPYLLAYPAIRCWSISHWYIALVVTATLFQIVPITVAFAANEDISTMHAPIINPKAASIAQIFKGFLVAASVLFALGNNFNILLAAYSGLMFFINIATAPARIYRSILNRVAAFGWAAVLGYAMTAYAYGLEGTVSGVTPVGVSVLSALVSGLCGIALYTCFRPQESDEWDYTSLVLASAYDNAFDNATLDNGVPNEAYSKPDAPCQSYGKDPTQGPIYADTQLRTNLVSRVRQQCTDVRNDVASEKKSKERLAALQRERPGGKGKLQADEMQPNPDPEGTGAASEGPSAAAGVSEEDKNSIDTFPMRETLTKLFEWLQCVVALVNQGTTTKLRMTLRDKYNAAWYVGYSPRPIGLSMEQMAFFVGRLVKADLLVPDRTGKPQFAHLVKDERLVHAMGEYLMLFDNGLPELDEQGKLPVFNYRD